MEEPAGSGWEHDYVVAIVAVTPPTIDSVKFLHISQFRMQKTDSLTIRGIDP